MDRPDSTQAARGGANSSPRGLVSAAKAAGPSLRWALLAAAVAWLGLGHALPAAAGGAFYTFVDEKGVTHFTNLPPRDKRYQPMKPREPYGYALAPAPKHWGYDGLIGLTAREQRVQPALVKAVIAAES